MTSAKPPLEIGSPQDKKFREQIARALFNARTSLFQVDGSYGYVAPGTYTIYQSGFLSTTLFSRPGDRLELEFYALYAANANGKSLEVTLVNENGTTIGAFGTGAIITPPTVNGTSMFWNIDFYLTQTSTVQQIQAKGRIITSETGANPSFYTQSVSASTFTGTRFAVRFQGSATTNGDISVNTIKGTFTPGQLRV